MVLPLLLWALLRLGSTGGRRAWMLAILAAAALASFALGVQLIAMDRISTAFFLSSPRAWEFLIGGIVAIEGFPVLRNVHLRHLVRGVGLVLIVVAIFLPRPERFPGLAALWPCLGTALFIWSGTGIATPAPSRNWILAVARFYGRISYSMYLWHWPLFAFARFSKNGLVLDPFDKISLSVLTLAVSYLSWRFVEQPFRTGTLVPTRGAAFGVAGVSTAVLLLGSVGGLIASQTPSDAERSALQLESYNTYDFQPLYRLNSCSAQAGRVFDDACLARASGKTNALLWGDSLAAHYFHGLSKTTDPQTLNIMQATQAACMPTLNAAAQGHASCRSFAEQMQALFPNREPDLVILSADWLEYARPPRFEGMIVDLKQTISQLNAIGVPVVLLGPTVQFRTRLPSMLMRAQLRHVVPAPDDFVLPDIFVLDQKMKTALSGLPRFSYISVLDAICPARQCPLTLAGGIPLSWDHAHLTAEGSVYVMNRLVPMLGWKR